MSLFNVVFYCCLCLICQTSVQDSVDIAPYILCENEKSPSLECPATTFIKIEDAIYGRTSWSVCKRLIIYKPISCRFTATSIVQRMCNSSQTCLPRAANDIYGDPCENVYKYLNVTYRCMKDEQLSSNPSTLLTTPFFTASPRSSSTTELHESLSKTGLAVGISVTIAATITIACVLIILRKRKSSPQKESTQTPTNAQDYVGTQNVAMPRSINSSEHKDLKVRRETHKYGDLQYKSKPTGDTCYDYIDANEIVMETKVVSVDKSICQNDSSSRTCQEYAMLDPSEKWNTELNTSSYQHTTCDDYTVLEAEKAITNHAAYPPSDHLKYKNNEVNSANNAKRDNYIVLDPKFTGFNRMNDTGNNKFDSNPRAMVHDTTHPVKENTNCYELAKPVLEDGKENTCHKYDGEYGSCQDSDYQLNAGHPTYSEEHVYNHTVDDVYDTTSHNKKRSAPDNTYDYFSGDQTVDDYNIPMKL